MNLVIVESPAKAKTIEKFLGKDFTVKSSMGHIRDLPKKGLGIDKESDFKPTYEISTEKKKVVSELKKLAKARKQFGLQLMKTAKARLFLGIYVKPWDLMQNKLSESFFTRSLKTPS